MCKAPKPPKPKEPEKPEFLRNRYLDAAVGQSGVVNALRAGRSSLRIDIAAPSGTGGAIPAPATPSPTPAPTPIRPMPDRAIPYGRRRGGVHIR